MAGINLDNRIALGPATTGTADNHQPPCCTDRCLPCPVQLAVMGCYKFSLPVLLLLGAAAACGVLTRGAAAVCDSANFRRHTDYPGADIVDAANPPRAASAKQCCNQCFKTRNCCAW